jgi:hypothetical protein
VAKDALGERGLQGLPGPPGPPGPRGATGARGKTGLRGRTGRRGPRGVSGPKGTKGAIGAKGATGQEPPRRKKLLDLVQTQIDRIDHELDVQLQRMAQIQREVDELRSNFKKLAERSN